MDNENLEIVTEVETGADVLTKPDMLKTYGPIAAGVLVGGLIGWAVCKFGPKIAAKFKKPAEEKAVASEASKEE